MRLKNYLWEQYRISQTNTNIFSAERTRPATSKKAGKKKRSRKKTTSLEAKKVRDKNSSSEKGGQEIGSDTK